MRWQSILVEWVSKSYFWVPRISPKEDQLKASYIRFYLLLLIFLSHLIIQFQSRVLCSTFVIIYYAFNIFLHGTGNKYPKPKLWDQVPILLLVVFNNIQGRLSNQAVFVQVPWTFVVSIRTNIFVGRKKVRVKLPMEFAQLARLNFSFLSVLGFLKVNWVI